MYHPYFRGKTYELITIRETANLLASCGFTPIIEPVREALNGLERALDAVRSENGSAIVIVNPDCGDHSTDGRSISEFLSDKFADEDGIAVGILLKPGMTTEEAMDIFHSHGGHRRALIHAGFTDAKGLASELADHLAETKQVFLEEHCGKLYRRHFTKAPERILIRDGFVRRKNADYSPMEGFSDLHCTYQEEGATGFGDFLVVGDVYTEGGGPAYAVAIHLTYIAPNEDDVMNIYHFVSTTRDTPTDVPGKFKQALTKLIDALESGQSNLIESTSVQEFRTLHQRGHFPGLGYVKKLSMNHHIETLADFLA